MYTLTQKRIWKKKLRGGGALRLCTNTQRNKNGWLRRRIVNGCAWSVCNRENNIFRLLKNNILVIYTQQWGCIYCATLTASIGDCCTSHLNAHTRSFRMLHLMRAQFHKKHTTCFLHASMRYLSMPITRKIKWALCKINIRITITMKNKKKIHFISVYIHILYQCKGCSLSSGCAKSSSHTHQEQGI